MTTLLVFQFGFDFGDATEGELFGDIDHATLRAPGNGMGEIMAEIGKLNLPFYQRDIAPGA